MFVLGVIPLSRTAPSEPLSYRSRVKHATGSLVTVPLRRKQLPGVVVSCVPVQEAKSELKTASFGALKSAEARTGSLPTPYTKAAREIATYHATTFGAVLSALLVPVLRDDAPLALKRSQNDAVVYDRLEAPQAERFAYYERLLAQYAGSAAVLLVVPTEAEARGAAARFKKHAPVVLTGSVTEKKRDVLLAAAYESHGLVITTPSFSWVPIASLARICIERVSAGGYQLLKRPHIDVRVALTELAKARSLPITYGDYPLPLEYRKRPASPLATGSLHPLDIYDVRKREDAEPVAWKAVPDELRAEIAAARSAGGGVIVLTARRGYAPAIVCRDCGTVATDEYGRTLSLATENGERIFRSSDGSTIEAARLLCATCGSWNLLPLGIGSERVEEELREAFPDASVARVDQDATPAQIRKHLKAAQETPGTILVGTELLLPMLPTDAPFALGVIASADSLLALPFWRARERFVRLGLMLNERTERTIVATRHPEDAALLALTDPADALFWQEETELRKLVQYPPFGTLLTFTSEGSRARISEAESFIRAAVAPLVPTFLEPRTQRANTYRHTGVLQLEVGAWPNAELSERIAHLPPSIRVLVNSDLLG